MMKTTIVSRIIGVVVCLILSLIASLPLQAWDKVYASNSSVSAYLLSPPTGVPKEGFGTTVYVPFDLFVERPEIVRLSFEITRSDNTREYDMGRLNFTSIGIKCTVNGNNSEMQVVNNAGLLQDFSTEGFLYTNELHSPAVNRGTFICPYGSDGKIDVSLVGTPITDPNPVMMHNGAMMIHHDPSMKVRRVKVIGLPFTLSEHVKDMMRDIKRIFPEDSFALYTEVALRVDMTTVTNDKQGAFYYPSLYETKGKCWVNFDGRLRPSRPDFALTMLGDCSMTIPKGCFSWLDLYEASSPSEIGTKVDMSTCTISEFPTDTGSLSLLTGLKKHGRRFYTLRHRLQ